MYLTAQEAADRLEISLPTLYSYVSRKQIRSAGQAGTRARLYWSEDIERLTKDQLLHTGDLLVPSSQITLITAKGPYYRGQSAIKLAQTETFETVCAILWGEAAPGAFDGPGLKRSELYDRVLDGLADASFNEKLAALLPLLERANPRAYDLSPAGYCRTGAEVIRWFADMVCGAPIDRHIPMHEAIVGGLGVDANWADIVRRVLVLAADHELDASTYAVRAVANSGVSAYQITLAGMATGSGRRLPFGHVQALTQMMNEVLLGENPAEPILRRHSEGESVHGFGSTMYPDGDPRADALLAALSERLGDDPQLARLKVAMEVAADVLGATPDFVIPLFFVDYKLGLSGREGVLFRLARLAGWIAHAMEQYHQQRLIRPRTVYLGALPDSSEI